ncbi:MAG: hypothetical protein Q4E62_08845 [Sutterellaceae bacterium]|nr:hypothetical protein [Sutterellaceae bacterium]
MTEQERIATSFLPEGCSLTQAVRDAHIRIAHVTRDQYGNFSERLGWLVTDVVCEDDSRVCIQYDKSDVFIDVPANEIAIISCREKSALMAQ